MRNLNFVIYQIFNKFKKKKKKELVIGDNVWMMEQQVQVFFELIQRILYVLLQDPTMTEGLNAKYNPALFILEACNNFGDSEQVEGRVLRKKKAPETTYFKVIYQYLSYHELINDGKWHGEKISKDLNNWFKSDGELEWFENPKTGDAYNHKEGPIFSEGIIIGTNFDKSQKNLTLIKEQRFIC